MRETVTYKWCDICFHQLQARTEATYTYSAVITSGMSGQAPRVIEVCETHQKVVLDFQKLIMKTVRLDQLHDQTGPSGLQPTRAAAAFNPAMALSCHICGQKQGSRSAMINHVWSKHRTDAKPKPPLTCPECGERFEKPQGTGAHRSAAHLWDALHDAYSGVPGYRKPGRLTAIAK